MQWQKNFTIIGRGLAEYREEQINYFSSNSGLRQ